LAAATWRYDAASVTDQATGDWSVMKVFVARQPIFDIHEKVYAYELLFRLGPENFFPRSVDGDHATSKIIHDSLHTFGLTELTGNKLAFINITRNILVQDLFTILPPERAAIELLETIEPDAEVIASCVAAKKAGYVIALDDFAFDPKYDAILRLADIVKIDFVATQGDMRRQMAERLSPFGVKLLAEKVETREEFQQAVRLGYHYFQGYFFCKPEMVSGEEVPSFKLNYLNLLSALNAATTDLDSLVQIVRQEPSLSVKLLRYLNSASFGSKAEIRSLKHAVVMLGERGFRKWATLVTLAGMGADKPDELLATCLVRAMFCEQVAVSAGILQDDIDFFLMGILFSIDVFFGRPLVEVLNKMALSEAMRETLLRTASAQIDRVSFDGDSRTDHVLRLALCYERGQWASCDARCAALGVDPTSISGVYEGAVTWANETLTMP
jgi:c-di-GMP-related signal transduction protein